MRQLRGTIAIQELIINTMNNETAEWANFLKSQGASDGTFNGNSAAVEAAADDWMTDLSDMVVIDVHGADAGDFLQAQFCNDVAALDPLSGAAAQLNGYCNPKGRLLALFHLVACAPDSSEPQAPGYRVVLPGAIAEAFVKRLRMFVLRAQVEFKLPEQPHRILGLGGSKVASALEGLFPAGHPSPEATSYSVEQSQDHLAVKLPGERWLLLSGQQQAQQTWASLIENLQPVGPNRWHLACINAGEPILYPDNVEQIIPQMLNLQAIDGLSFKKGCYPGQEIVARMQYLGKLKRRMYRVAIGTQTLPDAGAKLTTSDVADAGVVVNAAVGPDAAAQALVVIKDSVNIEQLACEGISGGFTELDLPYQLQPEQTA